MPAFIDLTGLKFGYWKVIKPVRDKNQIKWICKCKCGTKKLVQRTHLKSGKSKSCGCRPNKGNLKHGRAKGSPSNFSGAYKAWRSMHYRCNDTRKYSRNYKSYYLKGIKVCKRWKLFENFLNDMGERPNGLTLERKNRFKNYYSKNCIWASWRVQNNNSDNNTFITYKGKTKTIKQWYRKLKLKKLGLSYSCITERLRNKWSAKKAFETTLKVNQYR